MQIYDEENDYVRHLMKTDLGKIHRNCLKPAPVIIKIIVIVIKLVFMLWGTICNKHDYAEFQDHTLKICYGIRPI